MPSLYAFVCGLLSDDFIAITFFQFQSQNRLQQSKLRTEFENALSRYHAIQNVSVVFAETFLALLDKNIVLFLGK